MSDAEFVARQVGPYHQLYAVFNGLLTLSIVERLSFLRSRPKWLQSLIPGASYPIPYVVPELGVEAFVGLQVVSDEVGDQMSEEELAVLADDGFEPFGLHFQHGFEESSVRIYVWTVPVFQSLQNRGPRLGRAAAAKGLNIRDGEVDAAQQASDGLQLPFLLCVFKALFEEFNYL